MMLRGSLVFVGVLGLSRVAAAGGLFVPGHGAVSTSRAGAAVASADDGEAIAVNPAGIAKATGTTITFSAAMLSYAMEFQRRGTYDAVAGEAYPYAGQPFAAVQNDVSPPMGLGSVQPVPVFAVVSDLGGVVPGLHVALGIYPPNAYPFRDLCTKQAGGCQKFVFGADANAAPLPARYDIVKQEALVLLPSLVVAYRVAPAVDVGLRVSAARASLKSSTVLWGMPGNYTEDVKQDSLFNVDASDGFVPTFGLGVTVRPLPTLELGASYSYELAIHARGTATAQNGSSVAINGNVPVVLPKLDANALCAPGGTQDALQSCVDFALPQTATIGARYKFLDRHGALRGDVELDLAWENWGKTCDDVALARGECASPSDYRVIVDAQAVINNDLEHGVGLQPALVRHGLRDTYGLRLGGSYRIPVGAPRDDHASDEIIVRGGLAYDTAAARTGWLRADFDGAARTTLAIGAAYRARRFEVSVGGGAALEGTSQNPNVGGAGAPCNPTLTDAGCRGDGRDAPADERGGPDPINPLASTASQFESPIAQGEYRSHYTLFMVGVTTWF